MSPHPRSLVGSILTAIALMICLGSGVVVVLVVGRGDGAIQEANSAPDENGDCQFAAASAQLRIYQAPVEAPSQEKEVVLGGAAYPILKLNNGYYLLQLAGDDSGWANSADGTAQGSCKDIPRDDTPLADFPTVCAFTNAQEALLYSESDLINSIATVPPGTYLIESAGGSAYYIVADADHSGWVAAADGQIAGACQTLPGPSG